MRNFVISIQSVIQNGVRTYPEPIFWHGMGGGKPACVLMLIDEARQVGERSGEHSSIAFDLTTLTCVRWHQK